MQATVLYGARDVRFEDRPEPTIIDPTDAIISLPATCICGSDLSPYRGIQSFPQPAPMGHEYCGIVEEVGRSVTSLERGQFVIGSFFASDNTCPHCHHGYQTSCQHATPVGGAQAPRLRVPLADGTLVATREMPDTAHIPSLLPLSDVMGTGWFAADAANVKPGSTVVVVGDGAVGLLGVLSAKQMGAERIIAMSRHESRQRLAREFGATDIVTERGDEGVERMILHQPLSTAFDRTIAAYKALQALLADGKVRAIGVSHFMRDHLERLLGDNFDVFDFELSNQELAAIDALDTGVGGEPEPENHARAISPSNPRGMSRVFITGSTDGLGRAAARALSTRAITWFCTRGRVSAARPRFAVGRRRYWRFCQLSCFPTRSWVRTQNSEGSLTR